MSANDSALVRAQTRSASGVMRKLAGARFDEPVVAEPAQRLSSGRSAERNTRAARDSARCCSWTPRARATRSPEIAVRIARTRYTPAAPNQRTRAMRLGVKATDANAAVPSRRTGASAGYSSRWNQRKSPPSSTAKPRSARRTCKALALSRLTSPAG